MGLESPFTSSVRCFCHTSWRAAGCCCCTAHGQRAMSTSVAPCTACDPCCALDSFRPCARDTAGHGVQGRLCLRAFHLQPQSQRNEVPRVGLQGSLNQCGYLTAWSVLVTSAWAVPEPRINRRRPELVLPPTRHSSILPPIFVSPKRSRCINGTLLCSPLRFLVLLRRLSPPLSSLTSMCTAAASSAFSRTSPSSPTTSATCITAGQN